MLQRKSLERYYDVDSSFEEYDEVQSTSSTSVKRSLDASSGFSSHTKPPKFPKTKGFVPGTGFSNSADLTSRSQTAFEEMSMATKFSALVEGLKATEDLRIKRIETQLRAILFMTRKSEEEKSEMIENLMLQLNEHTEIPTFKQFCEMQKSTSSATSSASNTRPQNPTDSDFILSADLLKTMEAPESMDDLE